MKQQAPELDNLRKASHQAAVISGMGAIILFATLGFSAWNLQHLQTTQRQLEQEVAELEEKSSIKQAEITSLDTQISVLREQKKNLLADYRIEVPSAGKTTPIEFAVTPRADAVHTGEYFNDGKPKRYYSLWLDIPASRKDEIESVGYFFNHPSFRDKHMTGDPATPGFKVGYIGWGCMKRLVITLKLKNGQRKELDFNMCESILG
jgi:hypothetical protein